MYFMDNIDNTTSWAGVNHDWDTAMQIRHPNSVNVVFLTGHARTLRRPQFPFYTTNGTGTFRYAHETWFWRSKAAGVKYRYWKY